MTIKNPRVIPKLPSFLLHSRNSSSTSKISLRNRPPSHICSFHGSKGQSLLPTPSHTPRRKRNRLVSTPPKNIFVSLPLRNPDAKIENGCSKPPTTMGYMICGIMGFPNHQPPWVHGIFPPTRVSSPSVPVVPEAGLRRQLPETLRTAADLGVRLASLGWGHRGHREKWAHDLGKKWI